MNKTFDQIKQEIEREFIGGHYDGISATEKILTNIVGQSVKHYDTCIDDGADGDETEDTYVMKTCFTTNDDNITIRIFYGDVTEEIGYVSVEGSDPKRKEEFKCVTLSRADFEDLGYDTSNISDEQMARIAQKIGETLVENLYWECISFWGGEANMPKLNK
jgi:hypothetical protein